MKDIKLYKPTIANEKYGQVITIDYRGNQEIKDILKTQLLVDSKPYNLGEWLGKLASQVEYQQRDYERKIKELEEQFNKQIEIQKEINKNLLNAIREEQQGGTL